MDTHPDTAQVLVLPIYSQDMSHVHLTTLFSYYQDRENALCNIKSLQVLVSMFKYQVVLPYVGATPISLTTSSPCLNLGYVTWV